MNNIITKEHAQLYSACLIIIGIFLFATFGPSTMPMLLLFIAMVLPFYIGLQRWDLDESERVVFAIILGITIVPTIAYAIGFVLSFRLSIFITVAALSLIALLIRKKR